MTLFWLKCLLFCLFHFHKNFNSKSHVSVSSEIMATSYALSVSIFAYVFSRDLNLLVSFSSVISRTFSCQVIFHLIKSRLPSRSQCFRFCLFYFHENSISSDDFLV